MNSIQNYRRKLSIDNAAQANLSQLRSDIDIFFILTTEETKHEYIKNFKERGWKIEEYPRQNRIHNIILRVIKNDR